MSFHDLYAVDVKIEPKMDGILPETEYFYGPTKRGNVMLDQGPLSDWALHDPGVLILTS